MQPINYLLDNKDPVEALFGGIGKWQGMQSNKLQLERYSDENRLKKAQYDQEIQSYNELQGLNWNDPEAIRQFAAKYPDYAKGVKEYVGNLDGKQQQAMLSDLSQGMSLLRNGKADAALQMAIDKAAAYRNAGDEQKAAEYEQTANMIRTNPTAALQAMSLSYAVAAPKEFADNYKNMISANTPDVKQIDGGDAIYTQTINPITGEVTVSDKPTVIKGNTPDAVLQSSTQRYVSDNSLTGTKYSADSSRAASQYSADRGYQGTVYSADSATHRTEISEAAANARAQAELYFKKQQAEVQNKQAEMKEAGGKMWIVYKDGSFKPALDSNGQQLSGAATEKPLTEGQGKDLLFGKRMQQADEILATYEKTGGLKPLAENIPLIGDAYSRVMPSFLMGASEDQMKYAQAKRDFINAILRKESGAVIGEDEFANAEKQYFPQRGDSEAVIKQKAKNRQLAYNTILSTVPGHRKSDTQNDSSPNRKPLDSFFSHWCCVLINK